MPPQGSVLGLHVEKTHCPHPAEKEHPWARGAVAWHPGVSRQSFSQAPGRGGVCTFPVSGISVLFVYTVCLEDVVGGPDVSQRISRMGKAVSYNSRCANTRKF